MKNIAKGLIVFSFLALLVAGSPASAKNGKTEADFLNARAGLKAEALVKLESAAGAVLGPNGTIRVLGAKVVSATEDVVKATVAFGESILSFVVNIDASTKVNGSGDADASDLKAGDKVSFSGTITSSTSSSIVVDGDHLVSRALLSGDVESKTSWKGEVKAVNASDNSLTVELAGGRSVKVSVSSATVITLDGAASSLASLSEGDEVKVEGSINADGSVITATKLSAESEDADEDGDEDGDDEEDEDEDEDGKDKERGGWFWKIKQWFSNQ